jgi:hypothetical protein
METTMFTKQIQHRPSTPVISRVKQITKGVVLAGAIAALSLTTLPTTAEAGGNGVGAAIGLGVLGGVLAGAAIASSVPPVYAEPPAPVYGYPPQPWQGYYNTAPAYYPAQPPYYGYTPYR